ncbi:hypothetical protein F2981_15260 [Sinorhizobium meliloti]|nr:hypothetical protein [Sinorhizobium meliloti]
MRMKSEAIDLVTEGDEAAERLIKANIDADCAGGRVHRRGIRRRRSGAPRQARRADLAIVVDPIDGTFNFAAGLPLFGVMASVVAGGETVAGIIYDPLGNDWVIAERGSARGCAGPTDAGETVGHSRGHRRQHGRRRIGRVLRAGRAPHRHGQYGEGPDGQSYRLRGA